jgi:hypothetical protein
MVLRFLVKEEDTGSIPVLLVWTFRNIKIALLPI